LSSKYLCEFLKKFKTVLSFTDHKVRKYKEYHSVCPDSPERKEERKNEDWGQQKGGLRPEKNKERIGKREGKRKKKGESKKKTIESGCKLAKVRLTIGRESQ
jgi:hypothetical protein